MSGVLCGSLLPRLIPWPRDLVAKTMWITGALCKLLIYVCIDSQVRGSMVAYHQTFMKYSIFYASLINGLGVFF